MPSRRLSDRCSLLGNDPNLNRIVRFVEQCHAVERMPCCFRHFCVLQAEPCQDTDIFVSPSAYINDFAEEPFAEIPKAIRCNAPIIRRIGVDLIEEGHRADDHAARLQASSALLEYTERISSNMF